MYISAKYTSLLALVARPGIPLAGPIRPPAGRVSRSLDQDCNTGQLFASWDACWLYNSGAASLARHSSTGSGRNEQVLDRKVTPVKPFSPCASSSVFFPSAFFFFFFFGRCTHKSIGRDTRTATSSRPQLAR